MFKAVIAALFLATTAAIAQPSTPSQSDTDTYTYQPKMELERIPSDNIRVAPKDPSVPEGALQWCNTLRGKGLVVISIGDKIIFLAIDCPDQKMKDI